MHSDKNVLFIYQFSSNHLNLKFIHSWLKRRLKVVLVFVFCSSMTFFFTQSNFSTDTLTFSQRTLGSIQQIQENAVRFSAPFVFDYSDLNHSVFLQNNAFYHQRSRKEDAYIFSALPHIGFSYIFGNQGTQLVHANYQQALHNGWLLNAVIDLQSSQGFHRNAAFSDNSYRFNMRKIGKRSTYDLRLAYEGAKKAWNGGVLSDTLAYYYSPAFLPINKEDAYSRQSDFKIKLKHAHRILGDSLRFQALYLRHEFNSITRRNYETGDLTSLYSTVYFDTLKTDERFRFGELTNALGWRQQGKMLRQELGVGARLWQYKDTAYFRDTAEVFLEHRLELKAAKYLLRHEGYLNLVGANREWRTRWDAAGAWTKLELSAAVEVQNRLSAPMYRQQAGNVLWFSLNQLRLQRSAFVSGEAKYLFNNWKIKAKGEVLFFDKQLRFDSFLQEWNNELSTSTGTVFKLATNASWNYKFLELKAHYQFTTSPNKVLPMHVTGIFTTFRGGIMKGKKLQASGGVHVFYTSSLRPIVWNPSGTFIDWQATENQNMQKGYLNLSVYGSFEVSTVRFFFMVDNLGYFWSDSAINWTQGYTFPSMQVKAGITWDFWN